jgi:hypothetical protein
MRDGKSVRNALQENALGQLHVNDPFLGSADPKRFRDESPLWPGERWSSVELMNMTSAGNRRFEEYRFVPADGSREWLPVGFMFEARPDGGSDVRVYSDHHLVADRAPILPAVEGIHPWRDENDVLFHYFRALNGNRLDDVLDLFEPEGYFRHSNAETFQGREQLKQDFSKMMGSTGIRIRYCQFTDDGTTCAAEVYMPSGRPAVATYERGKAGKLRAVRIYL